MHIKVWYLQIDYLSKRVLSLKKKVHFCKSNFFYMNKYFSIFTFIIIFILSPAFVQTAIAQPPPPPPVDIPIDGGLGFLLAAGVAYAAKRLYKSRDKEAGM
jgi:hypothetical protein